MLLVAPVNYNEEDDHADQAVDYLQNQKGSGERLIEFVIVH